MTTIYNLININKFYCVISIKKQNPLIFKNTANLFNFLINSY